MPLSLRETVLAHALHAVARLGIRFATPLAAKRFVDGLGRRLPPYSELETARHASQVLGGSGACLSRSLAIAARLPRSEVVVGVNPRRTAVLDAHAWIEVDGIRLDGLPPNDARNFEEIARLR